MNQECEHCGKDTVADIRGDRHCRNQECFLYSQPSSPCKATGKDLWGYSVACDKSSGHGGFHRDSYARYHWQGGAA